MSFEPIRTPAAPELPRLFLREPGWRIALKVGSEREFCYVQNPGQDFYHRLMDGELYVYNGEERLCVPCAARRGYFQFEPRPLRDPVVAVDVEAPDGSSEYDVRS